MWRRQFRRFEGAAGSWNDEQFEQMALQSSAEDLATDDRGRSEPVLRRLTRPTHAFEIPLFQQERLNQLEHWRQQDEQLYPGGFRRRRSSTDDILDQGTSITPVITCSALVKLNLPDFFEFSVSSTRGHAYKLYNYRCKSVRAHFFACRMVNVWNSLPESVVFTSLSAFKRSIRIVDFAVFFKCNSI